MNAIHWPEAYHPGFSDNFASNEMIITGVSVTALWDKLIDTASWPGYYRNASDIHINGSDDPRLSAATRFRFTTFGFVVESEVNEFIAPTAGGAARLAWHGWCGENDTRLDVHHAWLIEALPGGRVRLLTQETQNGKPAIQLANTRPNPMINGHQEWLDGLIAAAKQTGHTAP